MRLSVLAVGRLKTGPEKLMAEDYRSRAEGFGRKLGITRLSVSEFSESQADTPAKRMEDEARMLGAAVAPKAFNIVLDEKGKELSSAAFANLLQRHLDQGTSDLAFLIGGPDGHAMATRESAGLLLSFGNMTWPHRLVRVMLLEQIYRAVTILAGHPYHRG
jgi:23S rRNA (pseudouridine1915-N3)-methyltransferase